MKGFYPSILMMTIGILLIAAIAFAIWWIYSPKAENAGRAAIESVGIGGLVLFGKRKKGALSTSTEILIAVVLLLAASVVIFLFWAGLQAEAGPGTNQVANNIFDAIITRLS